MSAQNLPLFPVEVFFKYYGSYDKHRPRLAICPLCKTIYRKGKGNPRGCSRACCRALAFWTFVEKTEGCWLWQGHLNSNGYGIFAHRSKRVSAYVFAYELVIGPVPEGLELDHLCRVTRCVNPAHLEPVTHSVNVRRGVSIAAQHAQQTHCKSGHAFTPENTSIEKSGSRRCLHCKRLRSREFYARKQLKRMLDDGQHTDTPASEP